MIFIYKSADHIESGSILTIGNFDGAHLGHKFLVNQIINKDFKTSVVTFWPHPKSFFDKNFIPLNSLDEKIYNLRLLNIEQLLVLEFNNMLMNLEPAKFIEEIILKQINPAYIVIGDDFRFGRNAIADANYLQEYLKNKIRVDIIQVRDKTTYSSTQAREAMRNGNFIELREVLGKNYEFMGVSRNFDNSIRIERELRLNMPDISFTVDVIYKNITHQSVCTIVKTVELQYK